MRLVDITITAEVNDCEITNMKKWNPEAINEFFQILLPSFDKVSVNIKDRPIIEIN